MRPFTGSVALVTGASRGIGAASARLLAENGFAVIVNYLKMRENAEKLVADIASAGGKSIALRADVRDRSAVETMVQATVESFGAVDVLVNNAIGELPAKPFSDLSWEDFQLLMDVQVRGAVNCCQTVLPLMEKKGRGSIINIISTFALGVPPSKMSPYVTTKAALLGLTRALATELTVKGIRVNSISPGPTDTDLLSGLPPRVKEMMALQNPMRRLGRPEDCARLVLFLATEASEYMSGANLVLSGGQVIV